MCSKKNHKNENDYQEGRYSDGKHFSKKNHKNVDKKSQVWISHWLMTK